MNQKIFISPNSWFKLTLPSNWDEYELEDEDGTYGFFNSQLSYWSGNLRITPLKLSDTNEEKMADFIKSQTAKHKASEITEDDFQCIFYKEMAENQSELLIYYWIVRKKELVFICSFTINKDKEFTKDIELQLQSVQQIVRSIKLL